MQGNPNNEPQPTRGGINPLLVILLMSGLFGLFGAVAILVGESDRATITPQDGPAQIATPAGSIMGTTAADFQLTAVNGELVSLSQFRGRPVFINLWYVDCPPCVREFPAFQQFTEEQGSEGAVILAINPVDDAGAIRTFLSEVGATDVTALIDPNGETTADYPYRAFPTTYLIDEFGVVRERKIGEITLNELYLYLEAISG
jgi:peroxiredoxin